MVATPTKNSLGDFMNQTGGNLKQAQSMLASARTAGTVAKPATPALSAPAPVTTSVKETINGQNRVGLTGVQDQYNPYTKGTEAINSNVGVNEGQYSMTNKQTLWDQSGGTGKFDMNAFYRGTDGSLQIKGDMIKKDPSTMQTADELNAYFNGKQITTFENRNITKAPTDSLGDYMSTFGNILGASKAPEAYSSTKDLETMRTQYGVSDLETRMNDLTAQKNELVAQNRQRGAYAQGKAVQMGVIAGRVGEIERQDNERLDALNRDLSSVTDQYKTKMSVISQVMDAHKTDYATASAKYESEYAKNYQMLQMYRDDKKTYDAKATEAEKVAYQREQDTKDDARATMQTMYNQVTSGTLNTAGLSGTQKALISKLELQAGYPPGLITQLYDKNPKADIVTQSTVEKDGKQVLNLVMRDKVTGAMSVQNIVMGSATIDKNRYQYKDDGTVFDSSTGQVKKSVDPSVVNTAITACRTTGQCGEGANDYLQKIGEQRIFGNDYVKDKKAYINSTTPSVGSVAIWNPANTKEGHLGVVVSETDDSVTIHDWNWSNDEKQKTHIVSKASIEKTGGYYTPNISPTNTKAQQTEVSDFKKDLSAYQTKVSNGDVSVDAAISYFKAMYPGADDAHIAWLKSQLGQ